MAGSNRLPGPAPTAVGGWCGGCAPPVASQSHAQESAGPSSRTHANRAAAQVVMWIGGANFSFMPTDEFKDQGVWRPYRAQGRRSLPTVRGLGSHSAWAPDSRSSDYRPRSVRVIRVARGAPIGVRALLRQAAAVRAQHQPAVRAARALSWRRSRDATADESPPGPQQRRHARAGCAVWASATFSARAAPWRHRRRPQSYG